MNFKKLAFVAIAAITLSGCAAQQIAQNQKAFDAEFAKLTAKCGSIPKVVGRMVERVECNIMASKQARLNTGGNESSANRQLFATARNIALLTDEGEITIEQGKTRMKMALLDERIAVKANNDRVIAADRQRAAGAAAAAAREFSRNLALQNQRFRTNCTSYRVGHMVQTNCN